MAAYYNEIDPYAAQWLRNLIARGLIAPGDVDERDIRDVRPVDLIGYEQCHFFAGIGGWSIALRMAGWPDSRAVWTGSCPCQPFSAAGAGAEFADERHLWPAWFHLIEACRPETIFGEQVASKAGLAWFDLVHADLEGADYAVGAADICAAGFGAPHIRQRLWFVAQSSGAERGSRRPERAGAGSCGPHAEPTGSSAARGVADAKRDGGRADEPQRQAQGREADGWAGGVDDAAGSRCDGALVGPEGEARHEARMRVLGEGSGPSGFWSDALWLPCTDGKARPVEPGIEPLAHGVQRRASKLRAYGNAIVPQVAAEFIHSFLEAEIFV